MKGDLCEFLGVKDGEKFKINNEDYTNTFMIKDYELYYSGMGIFGKVTQCYIYGDMFKYGVTPVAEFSEDEKSLASILLKLKPTVRYIGRDTCGVYIHDGEGNNYFQYLGCIFNEAFENVKMGCCYKVDDIINS